MCFIAWLAQSVEHETLNLRVVGSSPGRAMYLVDPKRETLKPIYLD